MMEWLLGYLEVTDVFSPNNFEGYTANSGIFWTNPQPFLELIQLVVVALGNTLNITIRPIFNPSAYAKC